MDEELKQAAKPDLSATLESLFSDPEARERFEGIVNSLKENLQSEGNKTEADVPMPVGDGLSAILSNPAIMQQLPNLLAGMQKQNAPAADSNKSAEDRRRDLLLALKPFLSKDRENAVDLILQISRLGAVLRMMR